VITFAVSDVAPEKPSKPIDRNAALRAVLGPHIEQLCPPGRPLVHCSSWNAFAHAAYVAFNEHLPLVITPDAIWFCLAQGFAQHISLRAKPLLSRLFGSKQKKELIVTCNFQLGYENDWPAVFADFSRQIADHVGKLRDLVAADFSTTGPIERAAFEILLMDTFQPYFEYTVYSMCGIPSITLLGTPDDWRSIKQRASMLSEFELAPWIDALMPVLDRIIATAEGKIDQSFWRSFFHAWSESGGDEITGWIQLLFPYLQRNQACNEAPGYRKVLVPNPYLLKWEHDKAGGPTMNELPSSLASAPVLFRYLFDDSRHPLRFVGGMMGVAQDEATGALQPDFGWAILYDSY
jgi:hypothetical protein